MSTTAARYELETVLVYWGNKKADMWVIKTKVEFKKVRIFIVYDTLDTNISSCDKILRKI